MKYLWALLAFFIMQPANAKIIIVGDVKVSVRADSAAAAREQALDQAHQLAFQKLLSEHFPERAGPLPSQDVLKDMVSDFSIDREKTTPTSYTASLTFQFDEPQVVNWVQRIQTHQPNQHGPSSSPFLPQPKEERKPLIIAVSYGNHAEWQHIKKTLETFPGVQKLSVFTLSPKNAKLEIIYRGSIDTLMQGLLQKNILLSQQEDGWMISSNEHALR